MSRFAVGDKVRVVRQLPSDRDEFGGPGWVEPMDSLLGCVGTVWYVGSYIQVNFGGIVWSFKETWLRAAKPPRKYTTWTTRDGRRVPIRKMTNEHLVNTIRAIEDRRVFASLGSKVESRREAWLAVLKAEALHRSLDWSQPPTCRVGLLDFVFDCLAEAGAPDTWKELARVELSKREIPQPEIEVSNLTGKVTYLHWAEGGRPSAEA